MSALLGSIGVHGGHAMLAGGFDAWRAAGLPLDRFAVVDVAGLALLREQRGDLQILDVRDDHEWAEQRIARLRPRHLPRPRAGGAAARSRPAGGGDLLHRPSQRDGGGPGTALRVLGGDPRHPRRGGLWAELGHPVEHSLPALTA